MDLELKGKRALVTGSSGGIGLEVVRTLASEGTRVVVHGRSEERARAAARDIRADGGEASVALGDLSTDEHAEAVADAALEAFDGIDVLVNNVGAFEVQPWDALDSDEWRATLEGNLLSTVRMCRQMIPGMRRRGWGRLVQIATVSATVAPPPFPAYAAAKAGVVNLTVALSKDLAGTGVTSNAVSPGPVETETWKAFALDVGASMGWDNQPLEEVKAQLLEGPMANPVGRVGRPRDVAPLVALLASPLAGYVNGENIRVDGGLVGTVT